MLFPHAILISLILSGEFLYIQTTYHIHRKSVRFITHRCALLKLLDGKIGQFCDMDLRNTMRAYILNRKSVCFDISWIHETDYSKGTLSGYHQTFVIPMESLRRALNGEEMRIMLLDRDGDTHCPVAFAPSGHAVIAMLDKQERRALSKALARFFQWRDDSVYLSRDWYAKDFFFRSEHSISGGLLLSSRTIIGKDGKEHQALVYSVHT